MSKAEWTEISTWKFYGATSNQVISGGGGGRVGTLQSVKGGGGVREVQSLTLLYNILTKIVAPSYTFNWKRYFFHMISY